MADGLNNNAKPTAPLVVVAEQRHLDGLVACHCLALPNEAVTKLGRSFLRSHFRYYIRHPEGLVLVAVEQQSGKVIGYMVGGAPWLRKRFLWTHALSLGPIILWKALTDPVVRARLREPVPPVAQGRRPEGPAGDGWPDDPPGTVATFLFLGAHPDYRRRGISTAILTALRAECRRRGYRAMRLKTPNTNAAAIGLYRSAGWRITGVGLRYTYFWCPTDPVDPAGDTR
jgi:ribosomal protein S18 acetylase RimI-like enzyme